MKAIESYHDLCTEISILEIRLNGLTDEMNHMSRMMYMSPRVKLVASYSGMPGSGMDMTPLNRQWDALCAVKTAIDDTLDVLALKNECKRRMEVVMQEFEGLEYRVAYMRDIQGLQLDEIANELNFSYSWIRKVSMRVKFMKEKIPS